MRVSTNSCAEPFFLSRVQSSPSVKNVAKAIQPACECDAAKASRATHLAWESLEPKSTSQQTHSATRWMQEFGSVIQARDCHPSHGKWWRFADKKGKR
jgi:hypothetical protein